MRERHLREEKTKISNEQRKKGRKRKKRREKKKKKREREREREREKKEKKEKKEGEYEGQQHSTLKTPWELSQAEASWPKKSNKSLSWNKFSHF